MAMALMEQQQAQTRRGRPMQPGATVGAMQPNNPVLTDATGVPSSVAPAVSPWTAAAQKPTVQPIGQSGIEAFDNPITTMAPAQGPSPWSGTVPDANAQQPGTVQPIGATVTTTQQPGHPSPWNLPAQPPATVAPVGSVPASLTPFTATDNLRGTQIAPTVDPRLQGTQGAVDSTVASLGNLQPAADVSRARSLTGQGLESLYSAPNRQELAGNTLNRFIEDQNLDYARRAQDVGRTAASLGRIGSGMTADDIVRLGRDREANIVRESARLADETAGQELADRVTRLGQSQNVLGSLSGEDRATEGQRLDRVGVLSGLEDQQFGQGLTQRNELRGERGYQGDLAQQAISNRFGQLDREQQAQQQAESQRLQRVGMASGTGFSNAPFGTTLAAAGGIEDAGRYGLDVAGNYAQELGQAGDGLDWGSILRSLGIGGGTPGIPQTVTDQAATIPSLPTTRPLSAAGALPTAPQLTPEQVAMLLRYYNG